MSDENRNWLAKFLQVPLLDTKRIAAAYTVAAIADAIQWGISAVGGPVVFGPIDEIIDVAAFVLISRLLGFHALLLPTFLLEAVPVADLLPGWTFCTHLVIQKRKEEQNYR